MRYVNDIFILVHVPTSTRFGELASLLSTCIGYRIAVSSPKLNNFYNLKALCRGMFVKQVFDEFETSIDSQSHFGLR